MGAPRGVGWSPPRRGQPRGGGGMDAGTDLVADDEERGLSGGHEGSEIVGAPEDRLVVVAAKEAIRDPEGQAVHEEQVGAAGQVATGGREVGRLLDGEPGGRTLRAVAGDAGGPGGIAGPRGGGGGNG